MVVMGHNEQTDQEQQVRRSIWRRRGWRLAAGTNVAVSVALAVVLLLIVNHISYRYFWRRWNVSSDRFYELSEDTRNVLANLETDVTVVAFFQPDHPWFRDVRYLLREYEQAVSRLEDISFKVKVVDPNRDLAETQRLVLQYDLTDPNVIVFEAGSRRRHVPAAELVVQTGRANAGQLFARSETAFCGEQVFSSAIQSITEKERPVVYMLAGHGEHDIDDYNRKAGYSSIATLMRRDNIEVKTLLLAQEGKLPDDCSALIVAGPAERLSISEVDLMSEYLDKNGRVMVLIDPLRRVGLDALLREWGVQPADGVVLGRETRTSGWELVVRRYGKHRITKALRQGNRMTTFCRPRPIDPVAVKDPRAGDVADRPRVTILAGVGAEGWVETDLDAPRRFDVNMDRPGPVAVAVAIEKGPVLGIDVELAPTRLVVIGDSQFASNGGLKDYGGYNADFFLGCVNWMLEREELMAILPKQPGELHLDMDQRQTRVAMLVVSGVFPLLAAAVGIVVWLRRRH